MSDLKQAFDEIVADENFDAPLAAVVGAGRKRLRRRMWLRGGGAAGSALAVAGLAIGAGAFRASPVAPAPAFASDTDAASAPQCVRDALAEANGLIQKGFHEAVVVDISGAPTADLTYGMTAGHGWTDAKAVAVITGPPGDAPTGTFRLWEGVTPDANPQPGRYLMLLFLDNSPKAPGGSYDGPVWGFTQAPIFPVTGDNISVTCADGTQAQVPWTDAATTWLAPAAPVPTRGHYPPGAAATESPRS